MKSTIKIDLGPMNGSVIRIKHVDTDDVRDRLIKQFYQNLNITSNLAFIEFTGCGKENGEDVTNFDLTSIPGNEAVKFINRLCISQCGEIIPLAFQVLSTEEQETVIGILSALHQEAVKNAPQGKTVAIA